MTTYLKVIGPDNRACHGGEFDYSNYLPAGDEPGAWLPERTPVLCESGWHWCTPESLMHWWAKPHMRAYEVEPSSDVTEPTSDGKSVSSSGRLLREYPLPQWWLDAMRFATEEIPTIPWMQRVGPVDPAWRVFPTRGAARNTALAGVRNAGWETARDAARNATWDAARNATWDTAWDAVWKATRNAAWDTALDAALDAARDAALYGVTRYVCADLPLAQEHRDLVAARWEVWKRGYGVACDVDGVLHVYEKVV